MGSLFKWEMKQTLTSKSFWIIGAAIVTLPSVLLLLTLVFSEGMSGYNAFIEGLSNYNAFVIFLIGVFAGIHVTGAFEARKIQSAVMAGNSRFNILMSKFLSYTISVGIYSIAAISLCTAIALNMQGLTGIDGTLGREVIARAVVYIIVELGYAATCFLSSMFIRHLGGAIGLNLGLMLMSNVLTQILFNFDWTVPYLRLTSVGQTMLVIGDSSNGNYAMAVASTVIAFAAVIALSYLRFRREELK